MLLHFEQYYGIRSEKSVQNAFRVVASAHGFHPIQNYLRKLRWDGNYRIRYLMIYIEGSTFYGSSPEKKHADGFLLRIGVSTSLSTGPATFFLLLFLGPAVI